MSTRIRVNGVLLHDEVRREPKLKGGVRVERDQVVRDEHSRVRISHSLERNRVSSDKARNAHIQIPLVKVRFNVPDGVVLDAQSVLILFFLLGSRDVTTLHRRDVIHTVPSDAVKDVVANRGVVRVQHIHRRFGGVVASALFNRNVAGLVSQAETRPTETR